MTTAIDAADLESAFLGLSRDGFAVLPDVLSHKEVQRVRVEARRGGSVGTDGGH